MGKSKGGGGPKRAPRPPLLNGDWFTPAAQQALEHTFKRFDADGDDALSMIELQAFARACNGGESFDDDEIDQIKKFFETNAQQNLTRKGFLQMYHTQTCSRPNDTWADLKALGFNDQLQLMEAQQTRSSGEPVAPALTPPDSKVAEAASPAATREALALVEQSDAAYTDGKHQAALRLALSALQADGTCADAHRASGRALFALGRVDAAERAWAKANEFAKTGRGERDGGESSLAMPVSAATGERKAKATPATSLDNEEVQPVTHKGKAAVSSAKADAEPSGCEAEHSDDGEISSIEDDGEDCEVDEDDGEDADEVEEVAFDENDVTIRLADYADPTDALLVGALLNAYAADPLGDGKPLPPEIPADLASKLAAVPGAFSVLAFASGRPAGLINCFQGFSTFKCKPLINVHDCYVSEFARGHRLAGRMLDEVERVARERGCCKVTLEVLSNNEKAKKAYTRFGFEPYVLDPAAGPAQFWQKGLN